MELRVEQPDESLRVRAMPFQEGRILRRVPERLVAPRTGQNRDPLSRQLLPLLRIRPVTVVRQQCATERRLQQRIQSLRVVTVAGHLHHERQTSVQGEEQVLPNADKPAVQRSAIALFRHAPEARLSPLAGRAADIDGMRVYDEKGGSSFSGGVISANAAERV